MRRLILIISMAAVGAAACGGGSSPTESAGPTEAASEENGEEETSVNAFLGFDPNDPDASAARFARLNMRVQELVATCMTNQGFEYIAASLPIDAQDFVFDEEEFAREQGFGISTRWLNEDDGDSIAEQWVDPNQDIVAGLSDSEEEAYMEALYGTPSDLEFGAFASDGAVESEELEPEPSEDSLWGRGCMGEASQEVYGQADEVFQELEPLFTELQERVESDPRVVEASGEWTACMADRGYDFQTVEELWDRGLEEFQTRYDELAGTRDPFAGWTEEDIEIFWETKSSEAIDDFFEQFQSEARQDVDQEALTALQQEERDLAVANYECGEKEREVTQEISQELEAQFISENRDALERARASLDPS